MDTTFQAIADNALLITFAKEISDAVHAKVIALDRAVAADPPVGVIETVPALVNLLVSFDPLITDHAAVEKSVKGQLIGLATQMIIGTERRVHICYEAPLSPDLDLVGKETGLSTEAVINAHLAGDYKVLMYGFSPGYAYLSGVADSIQIPRKATAIRDVPAGSVIVAGPQCLITTLTMPTGWSIIGRSATSILTGHDSHPFLFDVGDSVTFERVDLATFERLAGTLENG